MKNLRNFKTIAEEIWNARDEFDRNPITWGIFTRRFMHCDVPKIEDKAGNYKWHYNRKVWVEKTNKALSDIKKPCRLFNVQKVGVELLIGENAARTLMNKDLTKQIKAHNNAESRVIDFISALDGLDGKLKGKLSGVLKAYKGDVINARYAFFGRIASDPDLNGMIDLQELRKLLPDS